MSLRYLVQCWNFLRRKFSNESVKGGMPLKTKAMIYGQMSINQFNAAWVLADSTNPRVQSIIWLQNLFLALELSMKAYLIQNEIVMTDEDLRKKVGHRVTRWLRKNPEIKTLLANLTDAERDEFYRFLALYSQQRLRYFSVELIKSVSVENHSSFISFIKTIIDSNLRDIDSAGVTGLLNQ
jgi:hypothetical protein